jgi:hypothetical protein
VYSELMRLLTAWHESGQKLKAMMEGARAHRLEARLESLSKPGLDHLEAICDALNSGPDAPWFPELRRLIAAWQQSGPNMAAMFEADRELKKRLEADVRPVFVPTNTGRAYVYFQPRLVIESGRPMTAEESASTARSVFIVIALSPFWDRLGGPCPRCKAYFIRKTAKQSIYCSHRCASQDTAVKATIRARQQQHEEKLARAERAKAEWERLSKKGRTKKAWKEWVAKAERDITTRFLTRAVNKGELLPPPEAGS